MSPPIREGSGNSIGSIRLGDGSEISEVRTGAGDVLFSGSAIPDSALTQHLVAWYRFEDGDARDYTNDLDATFADTTAYDGTINGATHQSTGGVTDFDNGSNSGVFDFSGDRIDLPSFSSSFMEGDVFTISAFFKTSDTSRQIITGNFAGASPNRGNYIELDDENSDGNLDIAYRQKDDSANNDRLFVDGSSVDITTYTHVAVVRDGSGGATGTRIYINGQNQTLNTDTNDGATVSGIKTFDYEIGGNPKIGAQFIGKIDDVRFYDTNLSASQINDIYQNTKP